MWVLKIKLDSDKQFVGKLAIKHKISLAHYPISTYKDKKWLYLIAAGFIFGKDKDKKSFIKDLKKQSFVVEYEFKNDFGIGIVKQPLFTEPLWDTRIIRLSPVIINYKEKKNIMHLGSFSKEPLMKIYKLTKKTLNTEIIKFKKEKITNISYTTALPELTKKQKQAFGVAINNGYYDYPKKAELKQLAKIMKVSYSTYQEHLRKAESKIIPNVYKEF